MNVEIITIGDEILLGQIVDTNSAWIAQKLVDLQLPVLQITSITDREEHILQALTNASARASIILCTGGLGPTKDDVTKATIAKFFNSPLRHDEEVMNHVKKIFERFSRTMPERNYGQAEVLEKAEVLFNHWGTAPGMWIAHEGKIFVFLPGVPMEMKNLMTFSVLPKLQAFNPLEQIAIRHIITVGIGESHLAERIADLEEALPAYGHLAYLPKIGMVRLRLTFTGKDKHQMEEEASRYQQLLVDRLGTLVVSMEDISFEEVIVQEFVAQKMTLSTAESCTGGNLAKQITAVVGASQMFVGAIVAYANEVKNQWLDVSEETLNTHGAVSEETVIQMAKAVQQKMNTTYSIATSGIAGPGGGTAEKPVGTVWVAIAGKATVKTKLFHFHSDRAINVERTTAQAFLMLWDLYQSERLTLQN
ncbi:competence/damage-inducible protein A [Sphingobacterium sp. HJSM2_6]|uniref:competence/damage-inducible protein A n=1 Tax=Sphingobacterium sp. HJSM2_6 TaxID=3366264 RepID=UPI003BBDF93F